MSPFLFAWIASFLFGVLAILSKLTSKHAIKNPWVMMFLWSISVLVFTAVPAFASGITYPKQWLPILGMGICGFFIWIFYVLALYKLDISVLSPLYNLRTPISVVLSVLFLGELLTGFQFGLVIVITVAGIFVAYDEKLKFKAFFKRSIGLAILGIVSSALLGVFTKPAINTNGYWEATFWSVAVTQVLLLFTWSKFRQDILKVSPKQLVACILLAAIEALGVFAQNKAYATNVGISVTIINLPLSMVMAFIFSRFAPKLLEYHPWKIYAVRFAAAGVMIVMAIQLSR